MTRLVLVTLFTGPMNEMPPGLNGTAVAVGPAGCVAVGDRLEEVVVAVAVVPVVPVVGVDCVVVLPTPEHAVSKIIVTRTAAPTSIP